MWSKVSSLWMAASSLVSTDVLKLSMTWNSMHQDFISGGICGAGATFRAGTGIGGGAADCANATAPDAKNIAARKRTVSRWIIPRNRGLRGSTGILMSFRSMCQSGSDLQLRKIIREHVPPVVPIMAAPFPVVEPVLDSLGIENGG